jgi:hypothetical protein
MKERGIIMTGESVLGILAGRKTQTRRVVQDQALIISGGTVRGSRFGDVGDRLYVREAFAENYFGDAQPGTLKHGYKANYDEARSRIADVVPEPRWTSPLFMPRALSRVTIEIVAVRIERLRDITEADAIAEGVRKQADAIAEGVWKHSLGQWWCGAPHKIKGTPMALPTAIEAYASLWDHMNGKRDGGIHAWAKSPWVWVLTFSRITETA